MFLRAVNCNEGPIPGAVNGIETGVKFRVLKNYEAHESDGDEKVGRLHANHVFSVFITVGNEMPLSILSPIRAAMDLCVGEHHEHSKGDTNEKEINYYEESVQCLGGCAVEVIRGDGRIANFHHLILRIINVQESTRDDRKFVHKR